MQIPPDSYRVSDDEREKVAGFLGRALVEGRLTQDEYAERVGAVYAATTYRELRQQMADLPGGVLQPRALVVRKRRRRIPVALAVLWLIWLIGMTVNAVVYLIVVLTVDQPVYPWPLWVTGPAGTVLAIVTLSTRRCWPYRRS